MVGKRHELKYVVSKLDYLVLMGRIEKFLKRDDSCKNKSYSVTSLYFDNYKNRAYKQKIEGEALRHKYRLRYYNNDLSYIKLERKSKIYQVTMKISALLMPEEVKKIYQGNTDFLLHKKKFLYHDFYQQLNHGLLRPKVIVKYDREAFIHPIGDLRITFDQNLKTANTQTNIFNQNIHYHSTELSEQVIVEVKFNGVLPVYIRSLIQTNHVMQSSASKYIFSRRYNSIL